MAVTSYKRAQILATKALPQIAFAPQLNFLPKRKLARLQRAIADALWQGRPNWRSKHLLLCIAHKAHKLEPFLRRAVTTIVESVRFLKASAYARQSWQQLYVQDKLTPMNQFSQACIFLGIEWSSAFEIAAFDSAAVNTLDFSVSDLKGLLKSLAAHKCLLRRAICREKTFNHPLGLLTSP